MVDLKNNKVFKVIKNIWFAFASVLAVAFIVIMGVSCSRVNKPNNNNVNTDVINDVVKSRVNPKMASISGDNVIITADEVQYSFENLANTIIDYHTNGHLSNLSFLYVSWNNYTYMLSTVDYWSGDVIWFSNTVQDPEIITTVGLMLSNSVYGTPDILNYRFFEAENDAYLTSAFSIVVDEGTSTQEYQDIMGALEQDISANTRNIYSGNGIFDTMSSSMAAFIGSLSSGISAMVGVFYNNGALTVIGLLSVIVVAVSLAYFLFRLFIGLIRMRG